MSNLAGSYGSRYYADRAYDSDPYGQGAHVCDFIMTIPESDRRAFYCYMYGKDANDWNECPEFKPNVWEIKSKRNY